MTVSGPVPGSKGWVRSRLDALWRSSLSNIGVLALADVQSHGDLGRVVKRS